MWYAHSMEGGILEDTYHPVLPCSGMCSVCFCAKCSSGITPVLSNPMHTSITSRREA